MTTFRVLVVDDEPLAREAAVTLLRRDPEIGGVEECADGLSARDSIARTRPDIVFLDIEMPGLSGVQLAEDLQSEPPVSSSPRRSVSTRSAHSRSRPPTMC